MVLTRADAVAQPSRSRVRERPRPARRILSRDAEATFRIEGSWWVARRDFPPGKVKPGAPDFALDPRRTDPRVALTHRVARRLPDGRRPGVFSTGSTIDVADSPLPTACDTSAKPSNSTARLWVVREYSSRRHGPASSHPLTIPQVPSHDRGSDPYDGITAAQPRPSWLWCRGLARSIARRDLFEDETTASRRVRVAPARPAYNSPSTVLSETTSSSSGPGASGPRCGPPPAGTVSSLAPLAIDSWRLRT